MKRCCHKNRSVLDTVFIEPLEELIGAFSPFLQMTEQVIDSKSLSLSPPEFNVAPTFDEGLKDIAAKKNEAYNEIARIFDMVRIRRSVDG